MTTSASATAAAITLPSYTGSTVITLDPSAMQAINQVFATNFTNPNLQLFTTSDDPTKVVNFYNQQLTGSTSTATGQTLNMAGISGQSIAFSCPNNSSSSSSVGSGSSAATTAAGGSTGVGSSAGTTPSGTTTNNCTVLNLSTLSQSLTPGAGATATGGAGAIGGTTTPTVSAGTPGIGVTSGTTTAMTANSTGVEVVAVGPLDATTTGLLTSQIPALASQNLTAGKTLVMVFTGAFRSPTS
jgi:hypothetical protein